MSYCFYSSVTNVLNVQTLLTARICFIDLNLISFLNNIALFFYCNFHVSTELPTINISFYFHIFSIFYIMLSSQYPLLFWMTLFWYYVYIIWTPFIEGGNYFVDINLVPQNQTNKSILLFLGNLKKQFIHKIWIFFKFYVNFITHELHTVNKIIIIFLAKLRRSETKGRKWQ